MLQGIAYAMGQAQQAQGAPNQSPLMGLPFVYIAIFAIFYFLLIRPQHKKQKEHQNMVSSLKKNDDIITTGGIHGTIVNVKDNTFTVRVDDDVKIEVSKSAVAALKKKSQGE
ncbi:MAG: preprotein translocase subunit YajC [Candidatus Omnitrophica bacterium]|nr:preprotein translocase subunit YajC [Candidatus Omnitrophota bacterium]